MVSLFSKRAQRSDSAVRLLHNNHVSDRCPRYTIIGLTVRQDARLELWRISQQGCSCPLKIFPRHGKILNANILRIFSQMSSEIARSIDLLLLIEIRIGFHLNMTTCSAIRFLSRSFKYPAESITYIHPRSFPARTGLSLDSRDATAI